MSNDITSLNNPNKDNNYQGTDGCNNKLLATNNDWNTCSKCVEERHNLNTDQLDVSLDGIKKSFSIATAIDSNDKLSWIRLRRYKTWSEKSVPFQHYPLGITNQIHDISQAYITVCISILYINQDGELV